MLPSSEINDSEEQTAKRIRQEPAEIPKAVEGGKSDSEHLQRNCNSNIGNDTVMEKNNEETKDKSKENITVEKGLYFSIMILCVPTKKYINTVEIAVIFERRHSTKTWTLESISDCMTNYK